MGFVTERWVVAGYINMSKGEVTSGSLRAIKRQVERQHAEAGNRAAELEQLIDAADTNLSFVTVEVSGASGEWLQRPVGDVMSLDDLNQRYQVKNNAADSGQELLCLCRDWIRKTRKRVWVLLGFLGAREEGDQHLFRVIKDLRKRQLAGNSNMSMEVMECLHMLRDMVQFTVDTENRMKVLQRTCERPSREVKVPQLSC